MKCSYCGKDVVDGAKFCDGCGAKMEEEVAVAPAPVQETQYSYQPSQGGGNGGKIAAIIIAILILLVGIGIGVYFIFFNGKKEEKEKPVENSVVENKEPDKTPEPTQKPTQKPSVDDEEIKCTANMKTDEFEMTMNTDAYLTDSNRKIKKIVFTYIYDIKIPLIAEEFEKQKDIQCNTFKQSLNRGAKQDCTFERNGDNVKFVISFEELYSTYESTGTTRKADIVKSFEDQMKLEVKEYNGTAYCY